MNCRWCKHKIYWEAINCRWVHVETFDGRKVVTACEPDMQSTLATPEPENPKMKLDIEKVLNTHVVNVQRVVETPCLYPWDHGGGLKSRFHVHPEREFFERSPTFLYYWEQNHGKCLPLAPTTITLTEPSYDT